MPEALTIAELQQRTARPGRVEWIGIRPERRASPQSVNEVQSVAERGLEGDHALIKKPDGERQVTLIMQEHIQAAASALGRDSIDPGLLRRNIVTSGINLTGLKSRKVRIGGTVLEITKPCPPCSRMEENLGHGGYSAMRGHGGMCAKVLVAGKIAVGDTVEPLE